MRHALLGTIALLAAAAVTGAVWADDDEHGEGVEETRRVLRVFEILSDTLKTPEQAVEAATAARPGAAVEIELGTTLHDDRPVVVWEVGIVAGEALHEVLVDARSGTVLSQSEEAEDAEEARLYARVLARPGLSLADAVRRARSTIAGTVVEVELDDEGSSGVWELGVVSGGACGEVELSRKSGLVLIDDEHEDDEDDEDEEHDEDEDDEDEDD